VRDQVESELNALKAQVAQQDKKLKESVVEKAELDKQIYNLKVRKFKLSLVTF
jgi:hypothetical protein